MKSITKVMSKLRLALSTALVVVISILLVFPRVIQLKRHLHMACYVFGIDVSKYQGEIDWSQVGTHHPIEFVFIRSTMWKNGKDVFRRNWKGAQEGFIRGAITIIDPMKIQPNSLKIFFCSETREWRFCAGIRHRRGG